MTYFQILVLLVLVTIVGYRCVGSSEKKLVTVDHAGNQLQILRRSITSGILPGIRSDTDEDAVLTFNKKEIDAWQHTWPIQPELYPHWEVKTYSEDPQTWTVYVSPQQFSKTEFEQIIAVYEANRAMLDAALPKHFSDYLIMQHCDKFGRFIYGEKPRAVSFSATSNRYAPSSVYGFSDKAIINQQELIIQPDGRWELSVQQSEGEKKQGGNVANGQLTRRDSLIVLNLPPDDRWHEETFTLLPDAAGRADYLSEFVRADGKKLGDLYKIE